MLVEFISPREHQARVLLETSADGNDIKTILLQQIVRQVRVIDHANNANSQLVTNRFLNLNSERRLVRRACVRVLQRVVATRADIQHVDALVGQDAGELDGVVYGPGLGDLGDFFEPVGSGDAEEERHFFGDDFAGLFDELDGEAGAVFEAAAVVVFALVGDWREEGVDEVAVSLAVVSGIIITLVVKNLHRGSQWHQSLLSAHA
jgi:hypothetical protein